MYSIKTDLDITGAGTVGKDLLVKGNAVIKNNLRVDGSISFVNATFTAIETETANINSTLDVGGKATLSGGLDITGNTTIGSADGGSDTVTINSSATFNGTVSVGGDFSQTAGSATLQSTKVKSLEVEGETTLKGNLSAEVGTTAAFDKITSNSAEITTITATDITSTGTANFNNINVSGTFGGDFQLDDIDANTLNIKGASSLVGGVTLGSNITGLNGTASFKAISLGQNSQDSAVKLGFAYTAQDKRPTVILPNEVQSELVSPATLKVLKTATFGNASLSSYGITGNGLNKLDYLTITGNDTQDPSTPYLTVGGKAILNDVEFTGTVTGLTVDVSGQDLTPNSVVAAANIKGATLESTGNTTVGAKLTVTGDIAGTTATLSGALSAGSVSSGTITGTTSVSAPTISASTEVTAPTITASGTVSGQTINGTNISATTLTAPTISGNTNFTENVDITGSLTVGSLDLSTTDINAKSITTTAGATIGGDLVVQGSFDLSAANLNVKSLTTSGIVKSNDLVNANVLPVLNSTTITATTVNADDITVTGSANLGTIYSSSSVLVG